MVAVIRAVAVAALLALLVPATSSATVHGKAKSYAPPYKAGPQGGDEFNHIEADPGSGNIAILRTFPGIPPVAGCAPEPSAGWAMFRVKHKVTAPVSKVEVTFDGASDTYSWVTVGARDDKGEWLGVKKLQGPLGGSDTLVANLFHKPSPGETITLEFGLQLGDACPQVGAAAATFKSVTVK